MEKNERYGENVHLARIVVTPRVAKMLNGFTCGYPFIDQYLQEEASKDYERVTYVYLDVDEYTPVACLTIECSAIFFQRHGKNDKSDFLSAIEIDYFALSDKYQHLRMTKHSKYTLGDYIFTDVLLLLKQISKTTIGAAKVVLYSVKDAVSFYLRNGFNFFDEEMTADSWEFVEGCEPMHMDLNSFGGI